MWRQRHRMGEDGVLLGRREGAQVGWQKGSEVGQEATEEVVTTRGDKGIDIAATSVAVAFATAGALFAPSTTARYLFAVTVVALMV